MNTTGLLTHGHIDIFYSIRNVTLHWHVKSTRL